MTVSLKSKLKKDGYVFIGHYHSIKTTIEVAETIGVPLTPWADRRVQILMPSAAGTPNTYSGIYGLTAFPFHTDLAHWAVPPRFLILRCKKGYETISTLLLDGRILIDMITYDLLRRAIFRPRRPRNGTLNLMRLCDLTEDGLRLRWDELFLTPASEVGVKAGQRIRDGLPELERISIPLIHEGDTLLVDNWRMLHARPAIPSGCKDRKIERVYLEALH